MLTRRDFLKGLGGGAALVFSSPLWAGTQKSPEPVWTRVPALRNTDPRRLGTALADIDSRLPATGLVSSATYRDQDRLTWTHEATHGVNSLVRTRYAPRTGGYNAAYVLGGRAAVILEPRPVRLQEVARFVPNELKGHTTYSMYMVNAAVSWNNEPLYVFDEWTAYTNSATQFVNETHAGIPQDSISDLKYTAHFTIYSLCVAVAVNQAIRAKRINYDDTQLRLFVAWHWHRVMQLLANASDCKGYAAAISYYRRFAVGPGGADLRRWSRNYFGRAWVAAVMRAVSD